MKKHRISLYTKIHDYIAYKFKTYSNIKIDFTEYDFRNINEPNAIFLKMDILFKNKYNDHFFYYKFIEFSTKYFNNRLFLKHCHVCTLEMEKYNNKDLSFEEVKTIIDVVFSCEDFINFINNLNNSAN